MSYFLDSEGLQQSKHLHILAAAVLLEPCFEQPSQLSETLRQLPACERSRLVQRPGLLFEQGQVVQRIEDDRLAFITALVPGDDFAGAGNHHFMHLALHPYLAVPILRWHRVVVRAIANQRQRTDPRGDLLAGFIGRRGQRQHGRTVALEALTDGLGVSSQLALEPLPALGFQVSVQLFPARYAWNRNHEVPPSIANQAFDLALVVALGWTAELLREQIVTLQLGESPRLLPLFSPQNPRHSDLRVVVKYPRGHAAEVRKGPHMAFKERLCGLGGKCRNKAI